ncbi:MAG: deoxyribodipyrimidine photo-lyase, partial [Oligoflexia bacterium]|nr:deoxyribodipyrimidine photo-lyase [Oligoflexia bacterium]
MHVHRALWIKKMTDQKSRSICWIRRDLRLTDHRALFEATRQSDETVIVFVFDTKILSLLKNKKDKRLTFIIESLKEIDQKLKKLSSKLVILKGDPEVEIPKFAKKIHAGAVFANEDYELGAKSRDQNVKTKLTKLGVDFYLYKDQVVFSGGKILKSDKTPYRVFTPYKKVWLQSLKPDDTKKFIPHLNKLIAAHRINTLRIPLEYEKIGFSKVELKFLAGEVGANKSLKQFLKSIDNYDEARNFPALENGTSRLSPHLRFGTISIRELVRSAVSGNYSRGRQVWLSELIWRDFYQMILDQFPHVEKKAFLAKYENIKWPGRSEHFKAWCDGSTGYPIIDAAMRQLNETGWMHNRLRMVVASFLVKDLLIDWRRGEEYFAEKLLDFDLSANNGGWQWCAS